MTQRVNITLPEELLAQLDEAASCEHTSRSGLIRAAVLEHIGQARPATAAPSAMPAAAVAQAAAPAPVLRAFFAARADVLVAYLFGSVARGTSGPLSDIDVAVLLCWDMDERQASDIALDLAARLPQALGMPRVDVLVLNRAPVRLAWEAVREGVVVWGEDSPERVDFEIDTFHRQQDFGPVAESFGLAVLERIDDGRFGC